MNAFREPYEATCVIGSLDSGAVKNDILEYKLSKHMTRNATSIVSATHIGVLHNEVSNVIATWIIPPGLKNHSCHITEESIVVSGGVIDC